MIVHKNKGVWLSRYGGLTLVNQKGNYGRDTFHAAPERYGFYAFIYPYVEMFLAMSTKRKEVNEGTYKKFKAIDGFIWIHLEPKRKSEIVEMKNSWYKIHVSSLPGAIAKVYAKDSAEMGEIWGNNIGRLNPYSITSKDHLEVFVCRETKIA